VVVHHIPQIPKTGITELHIFSPVAHFVFEESPVKSRGLFNFFFIQARRKGH
jgi:hypothetical protein